MNIASLQPDSSTLIDQISSASSSASSFDAVLNNASAAAASHGRDRDQQLRHASEQLVSDAFIQPLLKQMRNSPFKVKMFHGGQAEQAFGQKLDTILSDRIVHSTNFPIVDAVYRSLSKHGVSASAPAAQGSIETHG